MDPMTASVLKLAREHDTAWNPPPNADRQRPLVLGIDCDPLDRNDLVAAMRYLEWQPDNRLPYCVVEAPFESAAAFAAAVIDKLRADVAVVDKGLRQDGVDRGPPPEPPRSADLASLVRYAEALGSHLSTVLDGLMLVIAPKRISDAAAFTAAVREITERRGREARLWVDVIAPAAGPLDSCVSHSIRFDVDKQALFDHIRSSGTETSKGPPDPLPALPKDKRDAIEKELGQSLMSLDVGRSLKFLVLDAGKALSEGKPKVAVRKLRAARMLCDTTGLDGEAMMMSVALGSAYVQAGNLRGAEACFERARRRAVETQKLGVETPALWGLGAVRVMNGRFDDARGCYERLLAASDAESPMRKEAARMIEACRRHDPRHGLDLGQGATS